LSNRRRLLSPILFNLYSEAIFQDALEDVEMAVKVNGMWINKIRYADDTTLIADNIHDLQQLVGEQGGVNQVATNTHNGRTTGILHSSEQSV